MSTLPEKIPILLRTLNEQKWKTAETLLENREDGKSIVVESYRSYDENKFKYIFILEKKDGKYVRHFFEF